MKQNLNEIRNCLLILTLAFDVVIGFVIAFF